MKEFKGTKGLWVKTDLNDGSGLHAIFSSKNNILVARTCYLPLSDYNAKLISCAPEMLEMLKECLDTFQCQDSTDKELKGKIEELITKATTI